MAFPKIVQFSISVAADDNDYMPPNRVPVSDREYAIRGFIANFFVRPAMNICLDFTAERLLRRRDV